MKIVAAEIWPVCMPLRQPYRIAYETVSHAENWFLRIETDSGVTGAGCAAPCEAVTGESPETVRRLFDTAVEPVLQGEDPLCRSRIRAHVKEPLKDAPATRAMVDMALYDVLGKTADLPVYRLLGHFRDRILTSVTIGICPIPDAVSMAIDFKKQHFRAIKIKGGLDVDADMERVSRIREAVGGEMALRFDANEGYNESDAIRFLAAAEKADIEIIEQPTPREQLQLLGRMTRRSEAAIMADESLMTSRDVIRLGEGEQVDMVNVKLMKVGGITDAVRIISVAAALEVDAMMGCMDESALGIAAGLHVALAHNAVTHADLDGHLDLIDDPSASAVRLSDGYLYPSSAPGLGWTPQS